jgi:hypothetical protein
LRKAIRNWKEKFLIPPGICDGDGGGLNKSLSRNPLILLKLTLLWYLRATLSSTVLFDIRARFFSIHDDDFDFLNGNPRFHGSNPQ